MGDQQQFEVQGNGGNLQSHLAYWHANPSIAGRAEFRRLGAKPILVYELGDALVAGRVDLQLDAPGGQDDIAFQTRIRTQ